MNAMLLLLMRFLSTKISMSFIAHIAFINIFFNLFALSKYNIFVFRIKQHEKIYIFRFINLLKKYFLFLAIMYDNYKSFF